ncbi:MAG: hypothetical protein AAF950_17395 [Pseudomonadota bacterium]
MGQREGAFFDRSSKRQVRLLYLKNSLMQESDKGTMKGDTGAFCGSIKIGFPMGRSRKKKDLLLKNPYCCFCGGLERATTIDHVPARTCFPGRAFPEGFEFPSCKSCQNKSRQDEQAFAFFVRILDHNDQNHNSEELNRMISGMVNNHPHLIPYFQSVSTSVGEFGIANVVNEETHNVIIRAARKIGVAIYYREQQRIPTLEHQIWATWCQVQYRDANEGLENFVKMTPLVTIGTRRNVDLGDRFTYRCNKADDPDILAFLATFGKGMAIVGAIADSVSARKIDTAEDWTSVAAMFD